MELRQYAAIAWKWLWLIVLGTALAGGTAWIVSFNLPPVYEAATTLLIQQADSSATGAIYADVLLSQRLADTYSLR
ncbi:MAG: hypothetical protein KKA73_27615 [Chloroflexi bacterium]|nr:hypothetical protein [Chloroflexota bacterium]MBU1751465.1 hypothetical protein [Chloroflexota bacterium]